MSIPAPRCWVELMLMPSRETGARANMGRVQSRAQKGTTDRIGELCVLTLE